MGYLSNMKIIISEDQFTRMVNNSKGWGLIGIVEDRPKVAPELVKTKSDYIELKYLGTIDGKVPSKKEKDKVYDTYGETPDEVENRNEPFKYNSDYRFVYNHNRPLFDRISSSVTKNIQRKDVIDMAKNFDTARKFYLAHRSHHDYARRNGMLIDLFPDETPEKKQEKKQKQIDDAIEIAKKYKSRTDMRNNDGKNFSRLKLAGLLDTVFPDKLDASLGETLINDILEEMGLEFKWDRGDGECKGEEIIKTTKKGKSYPYCPSYRFDFIIPNTPTNNQIIKNLPNGGIRIEFDGEFHFYDKITSRREGESFENDIKRDIIKNNYCNKKDIKLIRIYYKSNTSKKINKDILDGFDSNEQLFLGQDYPKLGWNEK